MKRAMYSILALLMFVLLSLPIYAESSDKNIVSRTAEIDGQHLHYLYAGHGPAVLLLHGFAETSRMWRPLIPLLAEKFTVIAPDLRGLATRRFQRIRST
jgi:alpha-beta hydrolase superfamily lysophospholipase